MTTDGFDIEKEAKELCDWLYTEATVKNPNPLKHILDFGHRCANEVLERAAKIVDDSQKYHRDLDGYEWIECMKNPIELAKEIRSLKTGEKNE